MPFYLVRYHKTKHIAISFPDFPHLPHEVSEFNAEQSTKGWDRGPGDSHGPRLVMRIQRSTDPSKSI